MHGNLMLLDLLRVQHKKYTFICCSHAFKQIRGLLFTLFLFNYSFKTGSVIYLLNLNKRIHYLFTYSKQDPLFIDLIETGFFIRLLI